MEYPTPTSNSIILESRIKTISTLPKRPLIPQKSLIILVKVFRNNLWVNLSSHYHRLEGCQHAQSIYTVLCVHIYKCLNVYRERERYSRWPVGQVHTSYMPTTIYTPRKRKTTPILSPGKNAPLQFNMDTQHCYNCLKQSPVPKHHFWISKSSKFLGCFHHQLLSAGHLALIIAVRLRHIPGIPSCQVLLPVLCVTTTCRTIGSALLPLESV